MRQVAIIGLLCAVASNAHPSSTLLTTGMAQTMICGTLHDESRWGPPNFGENPKTDSKFTVWIVSLRRPVVVNFGKDIRQTEQRKEFDEIQLSIDSGDRALVLRLEELNHTLIIVSGRLWTAVSQGDVTPVVLEVLDARKIKAGRGRTACRIEQN